MCVYAFSFNFREAVDYIHSQLSSRSTQVKVLTTQGNLLSSLAFRAEVTDKVKLQTYVFCCFFGISVLYEVCFSCCEVVGEYTEQSFECVVFGISHFGALCILSVTIGNCHFLCF